jgi:hypothetical protein
VIAAELDSSGVGVGALAAVPIAFDASVPPPAPRPVSVDPPGPFADRQIVHVSSDGFTPGDFVYLLQCAGSGASVGECRSMGFASVGSDGTVSAGVRVRRSLETFGSLETAIAATGDEESTDVDAAATFDCAVDECSIVVFSFQDAYANGATPLVIDPNLPPGAATVIRGRAHVRARGRSGPHRARHRVLARRAGRDGPVPAGAGADDSTGRRATCRRPCAS